MNTKVLVIGVSMQVANMLQKLLLLFLVEMNRLKFTTLECMGIIMTKHTHSIFGMVG